MALVWQLAVVRLLEAERSKMAYKYTQTPHFAKNKNKNKIKRNLASFWADSLSPFSNFSPKHIQTPSNTFDSSIFSKITMQSSYTQSSSPWFHTLDLRFKGVDVAFQLQSTLSTPCSYSNTNCCDAHELFYVSVRESYGGVSYLGCVTGI